MKTASFQTYTGPGRISIARFAPRRTPAGYRQYKALAPGTWFNSVEPAAYVRLFNAEILKPLDPQRVLRDLLALAGNEEPVLLCWEKPTDKNTFCHRAIVAEWFQSTIGLEVFELGYEGKPHPLTPKLAA